MKSKENLCYPYKKCIRDCRLDCMSSRSRARCQRSINKPRDGPVPPNVFILYVGAMAGSGQEEQLRSHFGSSHFGSSGDSSGSKIGGEVPVASGSVLSSPH